MARDNQKEPLTGHGEPEASSGGKEAARITPGTALRQAQEALLASEERHRALLTTIL